MLFAETGRSMQVSSAHCEGAFTFPKILIIVIIILFSLALLIVPNQKTKGKEKTAAMQGKALLLFCCFFSSFFARCLYFSWFEPFLLLNLVALCCYFNVTSFLFPLQSGVRGSKRQKKKKQHFFYVDN